MTKQKMIINTELGMVDYFVMVNEMASEYFNDNGEYQPHIGILNAMRLFYNHCVSGEYFDKPHDITNAMDMAELVKDEGFLRAFNNAIVAKSNSIKLDFANAYKDALDIVETKKHSFERIVQLVQNLSSSIIKSIEPMLTEDTVNVLSGLAKSIEKGDISAESIVKAYEQSARFKNVINGNVAENTVNTKS